MAEIYSNWWKTPLMLRRDFQYEQRPAFKPNGLWFDVDGEWREWCQGNDAFIETLAYRNVLDIDLAGVVRISTIKELDDFTLWNRAFGSDFGPDEWGFLDWGFVQAAFKGILIAPYLWRARLDSRWYYAWDCASGCIWDLSIVRSVTTVAPAYEAERGKP